MGKNKPTPAEAGKGQTTVASYHIVVEKPVENKNEGKLLKSMKKMYFRRTTMTTITMTVTVLSQQLFERRKELLRDPTRHQRIKEKM